MLLRPLLEREIGAAPALRLEAVDAVNLHPAGVDERGHRREEAVVLEVLSPPAVGREHEERAAPVPVGDDLCIAEGERVQDDVASHDQTLSRRSTRWGVQASRHAIQL